MIRTGKAARPRKIYQTLGRDTKEEVTLSGEDTELTREEATLNEEYTESTIQEEATPDKKDIEYPKEKETNLGKNMLT